jgi:CDP-diacylglycerol--serine O-phosphatidyltransferase
MMALAFLMISPVEYPAWPKIGLRTWAGRFGMLFVVVTVVGITFYAKYYFFLAGIAYVIFGLVRSVLMGLVDRPGARDDADEEERDDGRIGAPVAVPALASRVDADDLADDAELSPADAEERAARRRRRRRRRPPGGAPPAPGVGDI